MEAAQEWRPRFDYLLRQHNPRSHECLVKVPVCKDELNPEQSVQNTITAFAAEQVHQ